MSGPNAPLETALVWFGWRVRTYEIMGTHFNEPADLLDPDVQAEAEADIEAADFLGVAMDCSTFSRIREIPRPGITKARPLRDAEHPRGLPRLHEKGAERELHKVDQHNKLLDWSAEQLHAQHGRGGGWLSENPENSLYWIQQAVHELSECEDVVSYRYSACAHGAARAKKQRIDSNIPGIASQRARCLHVHDQHEWEPIRQPDGSRRLVAHEESEFTAGLVFYLAAEISAWAVCTGRAKLQLPRFRIRPVETGSRVGWHTLNPALLRSQAMPGHALRLRLEPASLSRHESCPVLTSAGHVQECRTDQFYVGRGCERLRLPPSEFQPIFPSGEGTAEYSPDWHSQVVRFADTVLGSTDWQRRIHELAQRTPVIRQLIVDEPPGVPSHGEVIAYWMWRARTENLPVLRRSGSSPAAPPRVPAPGLGPLQPRPGLAVPTG